MAALDEATRREIGQHLVFGFHGHQINEGVQILISKYYVGNIILMRRNIRDEKQTKGLIQTLQSLAKSAGHERPLMIGIDQENGLVSAFSSPTAGTQFPGAMAQAAIGDIDTTRSIASSCGKELALVGINWTYAPVADVNIDPLNPVIGVRAFGSDPKVVGEHAAAASQGFVSSKVASCAKHFPGHGDTHVDSHLALPIINKTKEELSVGDLPPFQVLIAAGVPSIMTAHIALPLVTGDNTPASLSKKVTTELLREELKYDGVIVTDCLEMEAVSAIEKGGCGTEEGALRALVAGADIAMICHTHVRQVGAVERIYAAVHDGKLSLEELKRSGERVAAMKGKFVGDWADVLNSKDETGFTEAWAFLKDRNSRLSLDAYRRSTAVVSDIRSLLPLKVPQGEQIVLLTPLRGKINLAVDNEEESTEPVRNTAPPYDQEFARILKERGTVKHIVYGQGEVPVLGNGTANLVIFVTRNAFRAQWQWSVLRKMVKEIPEKIPVVVVASCDPYDFKLIDGDLPKGRMAFVATHEFTAEAFASAGAVIFG